MPIPFDQIHESFWYTEFQFNQLNKASIVMVSMSLVSSVFVLVFYALFLIYERKKADRVSLRCVALGSIANVIDTVLDIVSTVHRGSEVYCRVMGLIIDFSDVISACFLSIIGINLILIFVMPIRRTDRLERLYYPCIFIYSVVAMIVPVVEEARAPISREPSYSCWFYNYIGDRERHIVSWMYYYGFIFLFTLCGLSCSTTAIIKLLQQEAQSSGILRRFTLLHDQHKDPRRRNHIRVIQRCAIYSLVPFLVNVWGFVIQIIASVDSSVPYGLAMTSTVFSGAEGLLTSLVFFSEPVIVSYTKEKMAKFHRSYMEEFSVLEMSGNGERIRRHRTRRSSISSNRSSISSLRMKGTAYTSSMFDTRNMVPRSATVKKEYSPEVDLGDVAALAPPTAPLEEPMDTEVRSIPMRRVSVSSSVYTRICDEYERRRSEESNISTLVSDKTIRMVPSLDTLDEVFIPYRSPALATLAHWLFVQFDRLRGRLRDFEDNESSAPSNGYTHNLAHRESFGPEVLVETPSVQSTAT